MENRKGRIESAGFFLQLSQAVQTGHRTTFIAEIRENVQIFTLDLTGFGAL